MRILLIEDDSASGMEVESLLKAKGYDCGAPEVGENGLEIGRLYDYDLIILDIMKPGTGGFDIIRLLRSSRIQTPILILSGISDPDHKIMGLYNGADDYMAKPFHPDELVARIQAMAGQAQRDTGSVIQTGALAVDLDSKTVRIEGQHIHLTDREIEILALLSRHKGTPLGKSQFLKKLYKAANKPDEKIVDVLVCKLRKKLADATGGLNYIKTIRKQGYVLFDPSEAGGSESTDRDLGRLRQAG